MQPSLDRPRPHAVTSSTSTSKADFGLGSRKPALKPIAHQTLVITGATSGIGLATAHAAARRGANLFLLARNNQALETVAKRLRGYGADVDYMSVDVADADAMDRAAAACVARFGGIDTWINNAGVGSYARHSEISDADHRRLFDTDYFGVVNGSRAAVRHMRDRGGALINIGSVLSDFGVSVQGAYVAAKHAVKGYTDSLRMELIEDDVPISVTLIKPAGIKTPFGEHAHNRMDVAPRVAPPVYHPDQVAQAVLKAAEQPTRSRFVGSAGIAMSLFANHLPRFADRVFARLLTKFSRAEGTPRRTRDGLHHSAVDRPRVLGDVPTTGRDGLADARYQHIAAMFGTGIAIGLAMRRRARSKIVRRRAQPWGRVASSSRT